MLKHQIQSLSDRILKQQYSTEDRSSDPSKRLNELASSQVFPADTRLFLQGSRAREVLLIEKGLVKLIRQEAEGIEIIAALRYPGWLLGTASVILNQPLPVTAVTLTPCHLRRIATNDFHRLIRTDVDFSHVLHTMLSREIYDEVAHLTGIECLTARQRLEEFIHRLISVAESGESGKSIRLQFPAKHSEIAQFLAVTPQYLSWLIAQLEKDGILHRNKGWLLIFDSERLWHRPELAELSFPIGRLPAVNAAR